jgi:hypothetical protein
MSVYGTPGWGITSYPKDWGADPFSNLTKPIYSYYSNGTYQLSQVTITKKNGAQEEQQIIHCASPFFLDSKELSKVFREKEMQIFDLERIQQVPEWQTRGMRFVREILEEKEFRIDHLQDLPGTIDLPLKKGCRLYGVKRSVKCWKMVKSWGPTAALWSASWLLNKNMATTSVFSEPVVGNVSMGQVTTAINDLYFLKSVGSAFQDTRAIASDARDEILISRAPHLFEKYIPRSHGDPILLKCPKCITNKSFSVLYPLSFDYDGVPYKYYDATNIEACAMRGFRVRLPDEEITLYPLEAAHFRQEFALNQPLCDAIFARKWIRRAYQAFVENPEAKTASLKPQAMQPPVTTCVTTTPGNTTSPSAYPLPPFEEKSTQKIAEEKKIN